MILKLIIGNFFFFFFLKDILKRMEFVDSVMKVAKVVKGEEKKIV
jgi:hypothetical protein